MNTNDQWFNPGDKVCRVSTLNAAGVNRKGFAETPFGQVFCVTDCRANRYGYNVITLAHTPNDFFYVARNFRRVDEIKLCVEAAKHIRQREEELV